MTDFEHKYVWNDKSIIPVQLALSSEACQSMIKNLTSGENVNIMAKKLNNILYHAADTSL